MKISLEIRPGEGGEDAKLLVKDQASIYIKYAERIGARVEISAEDHGWIDITVEGQSNLVQSLLSESGGHRWQRIPPTERKGRVHTSTVTVVALQIPEEREWSLNPKDIQTFVTKDSGPGGQHRNKTESCVIMRHIPTGIEAKAAEKCQHQNRRVAREVLEARVKNYLAQKKWAEMAQKKAECKGSGMRGDKIRTYRTQDDVVIDHRTENKFRLKDVKAGKLEKLLA